MILTVDGTMETYAKQCLYCTCKTLLSYEDEWTCFSCGYNVLIRKNELRKTHQETKLDQSV